MPREMAERIAAGMVAFWRDRVRHLDGHVIEEDDGVVVCLSNLPTDELNAALVEREPTDPRAALVRAMDVFEANGRAFGLEVEEGRHGTVDRAVRELGLVIAVSRAAMAVRVDEVRPPTPTEPVEIVRVTEPRRLAGLVDVEVAAFGTERPVAEGLFAASQLGLPNVRIYAAIADGRAVAQAWTNTWRGAVGIFGVGTVPELRHRGIGSAITAFAIDDVRDEADLAWLQSTEMGQPLYERMGFRSVSDWDVWVAR